MLEYTRNGDYYDENDYYYYYRVNMEGKQNGKTGKVGELRGNVFLHFIFEYPWPIRHLSEMHVLTDLPWLFCPAVLGKWTYQDVTNYD